MPGITGIIAKQSFEQHRPLLDSMVEALLHERFYTSGKYTNEKVGLLVGWTCLKEEFCDCLPIWNETRDVCLLFSGEDFADPKAVERLKQRHAFSSGDASYLVHMYEEEGPAFLANLNGWFSGVLVDLRAGSISLFNDRYGLGRIYYHETPDAFYFSSEAKSLLKVLPALRRVDLRGLGEAISCGCALQNRTVFSGVSLLPGASAWRFSHDKPVRKEQYFDRAQWEAQSPISSAEYYDKLSDTWRQILPRYFTGPRKIGMSLTGGLDGRMIMAYAPSTPGSLPCYTFGGSYRECTDVRIARKVSRACGQPHSVIRVDGEFIGNFPTLAERAVYISDGAMDVTGSVELYVNRIAREIAPVRMTGNYGSEILRGNIAFKPHSLDEELLTPSFAQLVKEAATTYTEETRCHPVSFIAFKQVPWHHHSRLALEKSLLTVRAPYLDNNLAALMYRAERAAVLSKQPCFRVIAEGTAGLNRIGTDRGLAWPPVPVVTRMRNLYEEFTFRSEYAYDYGMPQDLARLDHLLAPLHLERLFLGRHKFFHFRVWYRDKLSDYIKDVILDSRTRNRPYLNGKRLEQIVQGHLRGNRNYTTEIHKVLTCEFIQRQLIERNWDGA